MSRSADDARIAARHDDIPQDGLFDLDPVEPSRGERGVAERAVGSGECPSCHRKVGHLRRDGRLVWRHHTVRTYGGASLPCRMAEIEVEA